MVIEERKIAVADIYDGYKNDNEEGVYGYKGTLSIRPIYQREFVYQDKQRDEVIRTILKEFPLGLFYWCVTPKGYEVLDGQQRTISICEYIDGTFSVDGRYFHNLPSDIQKKILDYKLSVNVCNGTDSEKLEWFKIINIAGEELTDQELRNAVYAGTWTSDAKRYFSKTNGPAYREAKDYVKGSAIRQEYFETALKWIANSQDVSVEEYMARHQNDATAIELWNYFSGVIDWVKAVFPHYRKEMKGVDWGKLYDAHHTENLNPQELEQFINALMADEDVTKKKGVYEYVLTGNERALSIRAFSERDKRTAYERQQGICPICGRHFEYEEMDGDHITPWSKGGKTIPENCQMLCKECNQKKGGE